MSTFLREPEIQINNNVAYSTMQMLCFEIYRYRLIHNLKQKILFISRII